MSLIINKLGAAGSSLWLLALVYKKSVRPYLLPVPHSEALELPISVERANLQSLTQNMIRQQPMLAHCQPVDDYYSYSLWHLLFATFLTEIEVFQVSSCQERASSKRFPKMSLSKPSRVAHDRALLGRSTSANLHTIFVVYKIMGEFLCCGEAAGFATAPRL